MYYFNFHDHLKIPNQCICYILFGSDSHNDLVSILVNTKLLFDVLPEFREGGASDVLFSEVDGESILVALHLADEIL